MLSSVPTLSIFCTIWFIYARGIYGSMFWQFCKCPTRARLECTVLKEVILSLSGSDLLYLVFST